MATQVITEGEILEAGEQNDPDLNAAWWAFRDQLETEGNSGGSIAVFEVPTDANGVARPKTLNKTKLFTVPVGALSFDDVLDRVTRGFMEPGQTMTVQLLGTIDGKRGVQMNKMVRLKREKENVAPSDTSVTGILKLITEQNARNREEMRSMLEQLTAARAPAIDPMAMGLGLAEKFTSMAAQLARPGSGPAGVAPPDAMNQMMTMMMTAMMKKFLDGMDKPAAPTGASGSDFGDIVKAIAGVAAPLLQANAEEKRMAAMRAQRQLSHESSSPPPRAEAAPEPATAPEGAPTKEDAHVRLLTELKAGLPMLCDMAAQNADVAEVAKLICSAMPVDPDLDDAMFSLLSSETCVTQLAQLEPRVEPAKDWFEKFRAAMLVEYTPDAPA